jgi:serine/threonine-protein kinase
MGVVWAALDTISGAACALKLLTSTDDEGKRRDLSQRLRREARAASAVEHPNLVRILDVLELEDGSPALVMEYLEGESLAARLGRERVLSLGDFAKIFVQVLAGVEAVHARKIIHRDLKPENVFLVDGTPLAVKVLDFGIAKLTATEGELMASSSQTVTGAVLGTPLYMSPEQFGERDIDARADVWSLGLIAYRCLSGVLPTQGDSLLEIFRKIVDRQVQPLEEVAEGLPEDVTRLVGRMLSRKREDRPSDVREVAEVFALYAGGGASAPASNPGRTRPAKGEVDEYATTHMVSSKDMPAMRVTTDARAAPPSVRPANGGGKPFPRRALAVGIGVALVGAMATRLYVGSVTSGGTAASAGMARPPRRSAEPQAPQSSSAAEAAPPTAVAPPAPPPSALPPAEVTSSAQARVGIDAPPVETTARRARPSPARPAPTATASAIPVEPAVGGPTIAQHPPDR